MGPDKGWCRDLSPFEQLIDTRLSHRQAADSQPSSPLVSAAFKELQQGAGEGEPLPSFDCGPIGG